MFQVYAPDSSYGKDVVEEFYDMLQSKIDAIPKIMGDFNAIVGSDQQQVWPEAVGRYKLGETNDRGVQLILFCVINDLAISNT